MKRFIVLLIALFTLPCVALANDAPIDPINPIEGQPEDKDKIEPITWPEFQDIVIHEFDHQSSRLRIRAKEPSWYALQGQSAYEGYLSTTDWEYTEDRLKDELGDSSVHAIVEAWWRSPAGQRVEEWGETLKLRFFAEHEEVDDFESREKVRWGFLFGSKGSRAPDFGFEMSDKPEFRMEFYQRTKLFEAKMDRNGNKVEEPVLIRHRFSYKVTDMLGVEDNGRFQYEVDNIRGWFGMKLRYDLEDQTTAFFLDHFQVQEGIFFYGGLTHHGEDGEFGFHNDHQGVPEGSLTGHFGMHGAVFRISDIPKALIFWKWSSPFKRRQAKQERRMYAQRKEQTRYAAANE